MLFLPLLLFYLNLHNSEAATTTTTTNNKTNVNDINLINVFFMEKPNFDNYDLYVARAGDPFAHSELVKYKKINDKQDDSINDTMRSKRGVFELINMIKCSTGCNPFLYKRYGCFCGFLGSGKAVDGIDNCCQRHDLCYSIANCKCPVMLLSQYFTPYHWICHQNKPYCAIDPEQYGIWTGCASWLCECDRKLAECLKHYPCPSTKAVCSSSPFRFLQTIL